MLNKTDTIYQQQFDIWKQVRAILKGKYAVIDIVSCLPAPQYKQYPIYGGMNEAALRQAEQCNANNSLRKSAYWARGRLLNATQRTHDSLDGMVWAKDPEVNLPKKLNYLEDSSDKEGGGLRDVAQQVTDELIAIGRYGILVDMPPQKFDSNGNAVRPTDAEMESAELAPKFIKYKAEQIIYFRASSDGRSVDEIRLLEVKEEKKGEFDWEAKKYVRRLVIKDGIYWNELYSDDSKEGAKTEAPIESSAPKANGKNLTVIPFQFFGADNNSPHYSKIPLYDLTNINLGHFVLDCDNRDNLHYHGQGMTNIYTSMETEEFNMANPNGLDVGAKGRNLLGVDDKVEILQIAATGAIPEEMLRDEQRMIYVGAQLVQNSNTNQTLGAKIIENNASISSLKRIVNNASEGLTQCIEWAGDFLGVTEDIAYSINTEFVTDEMTADMLNHHFMVVQSGGLPISSYNESARKAGLTDKSDDELADALLDENSLGGTDEETATLQAELDGLREENERLRNA